MDIVTLDKGQVALPASILQQLGLYDQARLTAEVTEEGGVLLRPTSTSHEIEIYTDERLAEFEAENRLTEEEARRLDEALGRR